MDLIIITVIEVCLLGSETLLMSGLEIMQHILNKEKRKCNTIVMYTIMEYNTEKMTQNE